MHRLMMTLVLASLPLSLLAPATFAADWPQILGPSRNGITSAKLPLSKAKDGKLPELWAVDAGSGFSGPVVTGDRVILFHRVADEEIFECLEAATGERVWRVADPVDYGGDYDSDDGPKATPAIAGGLVYTFGIAGRLQCVGLEDGARKWSADTAKKLDARTGYFGMGCSPLVDDGRVYLNIGGPDGAGIVAFDAKKGDVVWKSTREGASYSSPSIATVNGRKRLFVFGRLNLVVLDPATGRVDLEFPWGQRGPTVNAAVPLVIGERVFVSTSYGVGAALVALVALEAAEAAEGGRLAAKKIWSSDDAMTNHYATAIHRDSLLYGFHGRHEYGPELRCVELASGKVRWRTGTVDPGSVLMADGKLLVLHESGELVVADPKPEKLVELRRLRVAGAGARAIPAITDGRIFVRDARRLRCLDAR